MIARGAIVVALLAALGSATVACRGLTNLSEAIARSDDAASRAAWVSDKAWHDGQAEKCVYEATRTIYGKERRYLAIAYTNKERVDTETTCKTENPKGFEAFKHHWSEIVPTEKYDYRFSTMTYTDVQSMLPYKLTVSTQEDCGASFKECCWKDGDLEWSDSVYFPGAGRRFGSMESARTTYFADALPLTLRELAFDASSVHASDGLGRAPWWHEGQSLTLLPSQKDTHAVSWTRVSRRLHRCEDAEIDLPIGKLRAREIDVQDDTGAVVERYWFATDSTPPMLNAMVRYEGPNGVTYQLKSIERTAYWKP